MEKLSGHYRADVEKMDGIFGVKENFDVIKKAVALPGGDELTFYYIDGFVKDTVLQKVILSFSGIDERLDEGEAGAREFVQKYVGAIEVDLTEDLQTMIGATLSGNALMLGSRFGTCAVLIDARTYPTRKTEEPEGDKVMRGARDGFVEALIDNTTLVRRRIRDTHLTMRHVQVGRCTRTDVVVCFMSDRADVAYANALYEKIAAIDCDSISLGHESLAEMLIPRGWWNPFPKIRTTERPDTAAAQLLEGSVLIFCDNTPEVMVLPTSIFDFTQETNDFYYPPLTGSFVRLLRHVILWLTVFLIPAWYLAVTKIPQLPEALRFLLPEGAGKIPLIFQLLLAEFSLDALRMASINTPDMLSNSLSVVGGLILGDFAVTVGLLVPEVILCMAFVAIANFTQRSYELGYALKFSRLFLLGLTAIFGLWGFVGGTAVFFFLVFSNSTANGGKSYLFPILPCRPRALLSTLIRTKKQPSDRRR